MKTIRRPPSDETKAQIGASVRAGAQRRRELAAALGARESHEWTVHQRIAKVARKTDVFRRYGGFILQRRDDLPAGEPRVWVFRDGFVVSGPWVSDFQAQAWCDGADARRRSP